MSADPAPVVPVLPPVEFTDADYLRGMERLLQAVQELSLARSIGDIQLIVRTAARELTGCDGATFVLRDNGKCFYADEDAIAPLWKGSRFPMEICISGWAMFNKAAAVIPDIYLDARIPHEAYRPTFVKSLVMVPIRQLDPVGAIGNYWAHQRQPSAPEVSLLQALADATSIAMENVRVYGELEQRVSERTAELERAYEEIRELSITDELTQLYNRRGFFLLAEPTLEAIRRDDRDCVLGFIDVDGLKQINDARGHAVGDALIADTAHILKSTVRPSDILARLGGDEFCVLITDPYADPTAVRRQLLDAVALFNEAEVRPYELSVSVGLMLVRADDIDDIDGLLNRADELMYLEKKARLSG